MRVKFKNGINGVPADWSDEVYYNIGTLKRGIESGDPGQAGIISYDNVELTMEFKPGPGKVYEAFGGDLSSAQRYIFELYAEKSNKTISKIFEGQANFLPINFTDDEPKINITVLDKLSALDLIDNTIPQREDPVVISGRCDPETEIITGFSCRGSGSIYPGGNNWSAFGNCGDEVVLVNIKRDSSFWGMPLAAQQPCVKRGETITGSGGEKYFVREAWVNLLPETLQTMFGYSITATWIRIYPVESINAGTQTIVMSVTEPAVYKSTYLLEDEEYIDMISDVPDSNGRYPVTGFDAVKILRQYLKKAWGTTEIINQTGFETYALNLSYFDKLIDNDPFGKHPRDVIKFIGDNLRAYIFYNSAGQFVIRKRTNLTAGTLRSLPPNKKGGGTRKLFWDKLCDQVKVTVSSGTVINGKALSGSAAVSKSAGLNPRNELKVEIAASAAIEYTQNDLDNYAQQAAQEIFNFYGKRHNYYKRSYRLCDSVYDWEILDRVIINGEECFTLSIEIDELKSTVTFEFVSIQGHEYNYQQARSILSAANYYSSSYNSGSGSSSGSSGQAGSYTFTSPLKLNGSAVSLEYSGNLKISGDDKLDTIQDIKTTSTTFQISKLGIGGTPDTNYGIKNYGNEWTTGNIKIDGSQSIGGEIDTGYKIKVYGSQKITGNLNIDGELNISGSINEVNLNDLNITDHAVRLNKGGTNTTALDGGIEMLGTGDTVQGTLLYKGSAWESSLDFNLVPGRSFKINSAEILNGTTLGSCVVNSSLTSVGTLVTGVWNASAINGQYINYNSTNLKVTSNQINTIQDISAGSSPQFANMNLSGVIDQQGSGTSYFGSQYILPKSNYYDNLGTINKKYLTLHAAELWVETLVAQNTIATIGGRILVGPTTTLTQDLAAGSSVITVKHNQMNYGDIVYMEANGKVEFMQVYSSYSGSAGNYTYTVLRDRDGSGSNDWYAGDAVFNTGQAGSGFIDIYSIRGVKTSSQTGPTIAGNIRNSAVYNDWSEHWAIGNLNNLYGYSTNIYGVGLGKYSNSSSFITIDPANGIRLSYKDSSGNIIDKIKLDMSGNVTIAGYLQVGGAAADVNTGTTTINGSQITTGSITLNKLNFTPVQTSNVIASINASSEGLVINGSRVQINGSTTFAGGYDPSTKTTSGEVTTIIGNTVTTSYLNARQITALGSVTAGTFNLANGTFSVDSGGKLISTSASIGGWDVTSSSITKTNTSGSKSIAISLSSAVTNNSTGLIMTTTDNSLTKIVVNAGSYNDGGYARYGFAIWDNVNSKFLMNIGYGGSTGDMTAKISGLTIEGTMLSSKFSTANTVDYSSNYLGLIMDGNYLHARNSHGSCYVQAWYHDAGWSLQVEPYPSSKTIEAACIDGARYIEIDGYNIPKCYGVTNEPPAVNLRIGDTYVGTNGAVWYWNSVNWVQIN